MKSSALAVLVVLSLSAVCQAQVGTEPLAWSPDHRALADGISSALVGVQAGATIWYDAKAWRAGDRKPTFRSVCAIAVALATTETLKRTFPEVRPDGSDDKSWPSGHSAASMALSGWHLEFGVPLSIFTGFLRDAANLHHVWLPVTRKVPDIPMGWIIGSVAQAACSALFR